MGGFGSFLFGEKGEMQQAQMYTPEQQKFMDMILKGAGGGMGSGMDYLSSILSGDESAYSKFEAPLKRQYEEQTIPALAERFAGLDAQRSSAFGQSLGQAGAGLTENLAALRENLKMQALQQLQGMAGMGLEQRFENIYKQGSSGLVGAAMGGIGQGAGMGVMGKLFG